MGMAGRPGLDAIISVAMGPPQGLMCDLPTPESRMLMSHSDLCQRALAGGICRIPGVRAISG